MRVHIIIINCSTFYKANFATSPLVSITCCYHINQYLLNSIFMFGFNLKTFIMKYYN